MAWVFCQTKESTWTEKWMFCSNKQKLFLQMYVGVKNLVIINKFLKLFFYCTDSFEIICNQNFYISDRNLLHTRFLKRKYFFWQGQFHFICVESNYRQKQSLRTYILWNMWIQMFQEAPMKKLKSQKVCKLKDWNFTEKDLYEFFQKLCKKFCSMSIFIKVLSPNSFHFWKTVYIYAFLPLKTSCFW